MPIGKIKWRTGLELDITQDWKCYFNLAKECKLDVYAEYFEFLVLHRSLMMNKEIKQGQFEIFLIAGTSRKLHVTLLAFESQMVEIYEVGFSL